MDVLFLGETKSITLLECSQASLEQKQHENEEVNCDLLDSTEVRNSAVFRARGFILIF